MTNNNNKRILEEFEEFCSGHRTIFTDNPTKYIKESDTKDFLIKSLRQQREDNINRLKKAKEELIQDRDKAEFDDIKALFNGQIIAINKEIEHYQSNK